MSSLIEGVRKALKLPGPHEHSSMTVYAGHSAEHARTAKLVEALVEIAEKASIACADWDLQCEDDKSKLYVTSRAIEKLESILKEMEKS